MDQQRPSGADAPPIEQLDLTAHGVLAHFAKSSRNIQLLNFLMALDRVDRWTVDFEEDDAGQDFEVQLFMQEVQAFVEASALALHRVPLEFADLLSNLTSSRCMYLIRYVSQRNEAFTGALAALLDDPAKQSVNVSAVRRRLEAFSKAHMLSEIFSAQRLREISQIMGSYADV